MDICIDCMHFVQVIGCNTGDSCMICVTEVTQSCMLPVYCKKDLHVGAATKIHSFEFPHLGHLVL